MRTAKKKGGINKEIVQKSELVGASGGDVEVGFFFF